MTLEIKTPALREALDLIRTAITDFDDPDADLQRIRSKAVVSKNIQDLVKTEVLSRKAALSIHAGEAKQIELKPDTKPGIEHKKPE